MGSYEKKSRLSGRTAAQQILEYLPMVLVAILITVFSVLQKQSVLRTLPTLISLLVQIMMSRANRYGFLVGGCNAFLYGVGYLTMGLYFSAASAALFSFPMQIWSFFHWKKHYDGNRVTFRIMKPWALGLTLLGTVLGWLFCLLCLRPLFTGAVYPEIDAYLFVAGCVVTVLMGIPFLESQYMNLFSGILSVVMWVLIVIEAPANANYLIISVYNATYTARACVRWTKAYLREKRKEKEVVV